MSPSPKAPSTAKPNSKCSFCEMTFKKLEHAQRHERTHTLDRPYTCTECNKAFARQDTLNRHSRLHARKPDGLAPKARARRVVIPKAKSDSSEQEAPPSPISPPMPFAQYNLAPPVPPFPEFSRSHAADGGRPLEHIVAAAGYISNSFDPVRLLAAAGAQEQSGLSSSRSYDFGRGLGAGLSPCSSSSESASGDEGSLYSTSVDGPPVDSHYPSPAFTAYSPGGLHEHLSELEAILANDPMHASLTVDCQLRASMADDYVDYDSFASAGAVTGPIASSEPSLSSLEQFYAADVSTRPRSCSQPSLASSQMSMLVPSQPTLIEGFALDFSFAQPEMASDTHPYRPPSIRSLTMPSCNTSDPALFSSFPSLSILPNGLGLHTNNSDQVLYEAYSKRRSMSHSSVAPVYAPIQGFYIPTETRYASQTSLLLPPWTGNASGMAYPETSMLYNNI